MLRIRSTCPLCDDAVVLAPTDVTLHLIGEGVAGNRYGFACPACEVFIVRPAGRHVVDALLAGNVQVATGAMAPWELPAAALGIVLVESPPHPEGINNPTSPPLDEADAEMFAILLADDDLLASWLAQA